MTITRDLTLCFAAIAIVSAALLWLGAWVGRTRSQRWSVAIALLPIAILMLYAFWLTDNPILTHWLPTADALLWGNMQLPAAALLAGIAFTSLRTPLWQRILLTVSLVGVGAWRECAPLLGQRPALGAQRWTNGVCRQTSKSSCSAAAAATLLACAGIQASEQEMVRLCLTHVEGTTNLGLYRGLKLKTDGTPWTVTAATPPATDIDHWPLPAVVTIRSTVGEGEWLGGNVGHSLVVLGRDADGDYLIADPFSGPQRWTRQELVDLYGGDLTALQLRSGRSKNN
jgi:hypothetical protein